MLLDDMCSHWLGHQKFMFGGEDGVMLEITPEDIWLILNLPYCGIQVVLVHLVCYIECDCLLDT